MATKVEEIIEQLKSLTLKNKADEKVIRFVDGSMNSRKISTVQLRCYFINKGSSRAFFYVLNL
jgi:hypothetical protein